MGTSVSFPQMEKIFSLLTDHQIDGEKCQRRLIESGLLADLVCAIGTDRLPDRVAFRKVLGLEPTAADFKIWRTVKLGTGIGRADSFRQVLEKAGFDIQSLDEQVFEAAIRSVSKCVVELDLIRVTLSDLGIWWADYKALCQHVQAIGLELCPPEVGLQLRLQYTDQQEGEILNILMDPLPGRYYLKGDEKKGDTPKIFIVCRRDCHPHDYKGSLETRHMQSYDAFAGPAHKFVLVRPRK